MNFLDLFSGIGGFALGAHWAGLHFDAHCFSEVDDYAIRIYQQRFPDAIPLGDIRGIRAADLPPGEWIIAGGFPCQDISVAGKGVGLDGARSGLWFEYARLIGELRPRYAIMENVGALAVRGLDRVLGSLAALGYDAEWQDIRASDVGAPHRRERIWIVGYPGGGGRGGITRGRARPEPENGPLQLEARPMADTSSRGFEGRNIPARSWDEGKGAPNALGGGEALADTNDQGLEGWSEYRRCACERTPWACCRAHEDERLARSGIRRVSHGVPEKMDRLKCIGNSIVPQIAELIFAQEAFDEWRTA